jgi:hypothetical protein
MFHYGQAGVVPLAILVYLGNGTLEKMTCLHQICFTLGQNAVENFKILEASFGELTMGRT